jgi:hypothetical protein
MNLICDFDQHNPHGAKSGEATYRRRIRERYRNGLTLDHSIHCGTKPVPGRAVQILGLKTIQIRRAHGARVCEF